jgi:hypothetical protein
MVTLLSITFLIESIYAYDNVKYGYSISPPDGWTVDENSDLTSVTFNPPPAYAGASFSIVVDESGGFTAVQIATAARQMLPLVFNNFTLLGESARMVGELNGYKLEYTVVQGVMELRLAQVIFVKNAYQYILTYGGLSTQYESLVPDFESSVNSLQITGVSPTGSLIDIAETSTPSPTASPTSLPTASPTLSPTASPSDSGFGFLNSTTMILIGVGIVIVVLVVVSLFLFLRKRQPPKGSIAETTPPSNS